MSESWRRKTHYPPRVLIDTQRILDPQFSDGLLCITGAQIEMLRNLCQYLHRRSTFSEDADKMGYLCPDTADWDTLQAIVADLEETLMGCEELMTVFEDMLTAMQCVCSKASASPTDAGSIEPIVQEGLDDGNLISDDPYGVDTEISTRRCAVAQLTYWQAWELLTEVIQPFQENSMDLAVPATLALIAGFVGAGPLAIPAGALLVIVGLFVDIWVDGTLADVQNSILAHREELICAVYNGLSYDYDAAYHRAKDVIDDIGALSSIDLIVMRALFAPWAIKTASLAHTAGTDWAIANVDADACDDCTWVYEQIYIFPPSPAAWTGGFPTYIGRYPGLNMNEEMYSEAFVLPSIVENVDIEIQIKFISCLPIAYTVGWIGVQYQDVGDAWHDVTGMSTTTSVLTGFVTDQTSVLTDLNVPRNDLQVEIKGMNGQSETDPWPLMPLYVRIKIYPHV